MLGIEFASVQIVFIRCLSSAVILVPLLAWRGSIADMHTQLGLNSLRVLLSSVAITINFFAISQIQLAQLSTIGYLRPAVTSLIAYFFLRESQSWQRWVVIVIGFAAVLLPAMVASMRVTSPKRLRIAPPSAMAFVVRPPVSVSA